MEYKLVYGSQSSKPLEFEVNIDTVYIRKNIEKITKQDDEDSQPYNIWQYEEKQMSLRDYILSLNK